MEETQRERLVRLLQNEAPESDFSDDEVLFSQIIADYADYARLLTENHDISDRLDAAQEQLASAEARLGSYESPPKAPTTDGIPVLHHGIQVGDVRNTSFFDLARG